MKFEWEKIHGTNSCETYRAKVFGGWIVNNLQIQFDDGQVASESSIFVPDTYHEWVIENE